MKYKKKKTEGSLWGGLWSFCKNLFVNKSFTLVCHSRMQCNYTKPLENKINVLDFLKGLHFALYAALLVCPCNVTRCKDSHIISWQFHRAADYDTKNLKLFRQKTPQTFTNYYNTINLFCIDIFEHQRWRTSFVPIKVDVNVRLVCRLSQLFYKRIWNTNLL